MNSERLHVQLSSAVCNNEIYPISLKVYDLDGLEGIFVPGAITRDVTKEGISQGIGGMGITSLDPSLGAQAAAAGIETAKSSVEQKNKGCGRHRQSGPPGTIGKSPYRSDDIIHISHYLKLFKMKKIAYSVLLVMITIAAFSQPVTSVLPATASIIHYKLSVGYNTTTVLIFPAPVKQADRGERDLLAQKQPGVENVLKVKAARRDFPLYQSACIYE